MVVLLRQKKHNSGNCAKCGVWRRSLHRDHIIPKFTGGSDDPSNIQDLCANCHEDKTVTDLTGVSMSERARARQSAAQTGKPCSEERRAAIIAARRTPESRAKSSQASLKQTSEFRSEYQRRGWERLSPEERRVRAAGMIAGGVSHRFGQAESNTRAWEKHS